MIKVIQKVYLMNDLKANMLIKNNFIDSKQIIIDVVKNIIYIESCNVIININIKIIKFMTYERR